MPHSRIALPALALLLATLGLPAMAGSSASSASSDSVSTSVGSISTSFETSSESSTKGDDVAEGEYRIIEVAVAEQRPGAMRLKLQAVAKPGAESEFYLYLPHQALAQGRLETGHVVTARKRPYGLEFAKADAPFFLVLQDAWYREMSTKAITL